jgi:actin-like ATPase involved in cell morphogenesis
MLVASAWRGADPSAADGAMDLQARKYGGGRGDVPYIGIDFGTTASKMAWFNPRTGQAEVLLNAEGEQKTPSVVYFGDEEILVGTPAEQMLEFPEDRKRIVASIKRNLVQTPQLWLAGRPVRAIDVAAAILRKLKKDAEELHFHEPVKQAVVTHPASFNVLQRDKIAEAARLAGFETVVILAEPIGAALAYARAGLSVGNRLLVYDLGGGTFDVALLARENGSWRLAIEPRGLDYCGGDDFDRALYDYCEERAFAEMGGSISEGGLIDLQFLQLCRQRKESLSLQARALFSTLVQVNGQAVPFKQTIERTTFEELIGERVRSTVALTEETVKESAGEAIDTVVLVGGSSKVPMIARLLQDTLPVPPVRWGFQDVAVALGAAHHARAVFEPQTRTPVPEPRREPEPTPVPKAEPTAVHEPQPTPVHEPERTPVHEPERTPVHEPEPVSVSTPEPGSVVERKPVPGPGAVPSPSPTLVPRPAPQTTPASGPVPAHVPGLGIERTKIAVLAGSALLVLGTLINASLGGGGQSVNLWTDGHGIGEFLFFAALASVILTFFRPLSRFVWLVGAVALVTTVLWPLILHGTFSEVSAQWGISIPILGALSIVVGSSAEVIRGGRPAVAHDVLATGAGPAGTVSSPGSKALGPRIIVGLAGAALLLLGIFLPAVSYANQSWNLWWPDYFGAAPELVLSLSCAVLVLFREYVKALFVLGGLALATLLWEVAVLGQEGGGFSPSWGWIVLILGALLILITPLVPEATAQRRQA